MFYDEDMYAQGMDAIAEQVVEVLGAEAADALGPLASILRAGGEMAASAAGAREKSKADAAARAQMLAAGESAWGRMKRAAEAAKWPQDISPRVVLLDKTWQASKHSGDPETLKRLTEEMGMMAQQIEARLGGYAGPAGYAPPKLGVPLWAKLALGAVTLGAGVIGYKALRKAA